MSQSPLKFHQRMSPARQDLSRRGILIAGGLGISGVLVGCSAPSIPGITSDPDEEPKLQTAASEQALIVLYSAVISAVPNLTSELDVIRNQHVQHLSAIATDLDLPAESPPVPTVPTNRAAAINLLRQAERAAARLRTDSALAAQDTDIVELLVRIGASEAGHNAYLQGINA